MARSSTRKRKPRGRPVRRGPFYLIALLVLAGIIYAAWFWWDMRSWRPSEQIYPEQGAVITSANPTVRFATLAALGGQFTYLAAGSGADPRFAKRLAEAQEAGLQVGVLFPFDPCALADPQSDQFTRLVARDAALLPPALELSRTAADCPDKVSNAAVESELMTLINQLEMHAGKPVILKLSQEFEEHHRIAQTIGRDLWLERDRVRPDYAGRPWLLWSANRQLVSEAAEDPIEWVVVQN